jgi:hypothetical protein
MSDTEPTPKSEAELKERKAEIQELLRAFREEQQDLFDFDFKGVTALLVAHGAGIAGCFTLLKDAAQVPPHLKDIGEFILMFAGGFFLAVLGYILLFIMRQRTLLAIMRQRTLIVGSVMALRTPERSRLPPTEPTPKSEAELKAEIQPPWWLLIATYLISFSSALILLLAVLWAGWQLYPL